MSTTSRSTGNRSSLVFLAGLALAAGIAVSGDGLQHYLLSRGGVAIDLDSAYQRQQERSLTPQDIHAAKVAWRYFETNYRSESGFVDAVAGFPSGTLWDQGSYLFALLAAEGLGIIDPGHFGVRVDHLLTALERMPLFDDRLPNKVYDSRSLAMVNYKNDPVPDGVGWSALDNARMLTALRVLEHRRPDHGPRIRALLRDWDLAAMADEGRLQGAQRDGSDVLYRQEGRIGYEQYGARAAAMWGLDTLAAGSARNIMEWYEVSGIDVPVDLRRASAFRAITPTLSEPFFLQGLELGFDREGATLAKRVYAAQERRHRDTGQITMVSEDNVNQEPFFLYSSVYSNGSPWAVVSEDGDLYPELRTVSLKAAFAWDALFATDYTALARSSLADLETDGGWASGRYEVDGRINDVVTANTNAVVLEAIHFIAHGPLWSLR
ncbi:DUF3131 domain-containing protein [Phaeobacter italicus]|jgi:hypothetical protein|uniref:DUF3131 domain-containing protein n=1 Tax=Phaeobacter italicus TaxID=481446 RepID=UPI00248EB36B|nr:DUF3131 domain-containing protein [Phaeobacter italicus]